MSQVSLPVTRPVGRALLVGNPSSRTDVRETLGRLGYGCAEADDPYTGMAEICRRPLVYRAVILSLAALYREELAMVCALKSRYPHLELWLAHTDGRQAALAEAMRLGADGLLDDDGLHRVAFQSPVQAGLANQEMIEQTSAKAAEATIEEDPADQASSGEPVLSADELRALLQEETGVPPGGEG
jgi:hypothetical protein